MKKEDIMYNIPVIPMRNTVVFPHSVAHLEIARKSSVNAATNAMRSNRYVFLTLQKDAFLNDPDFQDVEELGVVARILQLIKNTEGQVKIVVEGLQKGRFANGLCLKPCMRADIELIEKQDIPDNSKDLALMRTIGELYFHYSAYFPRLTPEFAKKLEGFENLSDFSEFIAGSLAIDYRQKQKLLEIMDKRRFADELVSTLQQETEILEIQNDIRKKARRKMDAQQRDYYLSEQMKAIREELGDDQDSETDEYRIMIESFAIPEQNKLILYKECDKLERMPFGSHEGSLIRNYIETCLELPWGIYSKDKIDISKVRRSLDRNHYGLEKVKERIIELLAVKVLNEDVKGQILCLVGPPGVGKTSIAQSIAKAINRRCQRVSLGGVRDEAEIRGHRRTYIGAMCGRIMAAINKAEVSNPLIILDEIDKLANDYKGDPTSALLEVLDSEQNSSFHDHYIDMPFDLSKVMFITTANDASEIPDPLRDRMELIELESYTREEKFHIARKHLIPRALKNCGMKASNVKITNDCLYAIIDSYTKEAGVRTLERTIQKVLSKAAVKIVEEGYSKITIDREMLRKYLGAEKFKADKLPKCDEVGIVTGLAWTSAGGEVLPIEVAIVDGTGKLELTGSLGDIMQESAKAALTCVRSYSDKYGISSEFYKNNDIHIHAPEGAVPKDGPSAGITMATALISALTATPVKKNVAMTGEITLRGRVLPIGGLKEKSIAAFKTGIDTVIIPQDNLPDLEDIDPIVKSKINFIPVSEISQVLDASLAKPKKADKEEPEKKKSTRRHKSESNRNTSAVTAKGLKV